MSTIALFILVIYRCTKHDEIARQMSQSYKRKVTRQNNALADYLPNSARPPRPEFVSDKSADCLVWSGRVRVVEFGS